MPTLGPGAHSSQVDVLSCCIPYNVRVTNFILHLAFRG